MNTHPTLEAARAYAADKPGVTHIIEIEQADGTTAYIAAKCDADYFRCALRRKPLPEIAAVIADHPTQATLDAQRALDANVPGLDELRAAMEAMVTEEDRYRSAMTQMMDRGTGRGPKPVDKSIAVRYKEVAAQYPRAAAYLRAEGEYEHSVVGHARRAEAAKRAMQILVAGGSIEDAEQARQDW